MQTTERCPAYAQGIYAALATPCRPGSIEADSAALLEYLDRVTTAGVDGLVLYGSTGDFVHFDTEDRMRTAGLALKRSRVPVLVNVSHSTLAGAKSLAEHAIDTGAAGILLMPPYFYPYNPADIEPFLAQFADAMDGRVPAYLYNLPASTTPIPSEVASRLLTSGAYAGIKDSSGDWTYFQALVDCRAKRPFRLLAGNERILRPALEAGADGVVSGLAAAIPELLVGLWRAAKADDRKQVDGLERQLQSFLDWIQKLPPTVAIKEAAGFRKWFAPSHAIPLSQPNTKTLREFRSWLIEWMPAMLVQSRPAAYKQ